MSGERMQAGREMDVLTAERLWTIRADGWPANPYEWWWWFTDDDGATVPRLPQFSTDIAAAMELENRIDTLGLREAYSEALADVVLGSYPASINDDELFRIAHATPEQRCRAALAAVDAAREAAHD